MLSFQLSTRLSTERFIILMVRKRNRSIEFGYQNKALSQ